MVPSRLQSLCVVASLVAAAYRTQAVPVTLEATAIYAGESDCKGATGNPVVVTATPKACAASVACVVTDTLYPATVCSATDGTATGAFIKTDLPSLFKSGPYVVVESYTANSDCAAQGDIETITAYLADGKCHQTGASTSFIAVRKVDGTAAVKTFDAVPDCSGVDSKTLIITAAQYTGNTCMPGDDGIADTKIFGAGSTDVYLTSAATFVDDVAKCQMSAGSTLTQLVTTTVSAAACTATANACASGTAEPYTNTVCGKKADYADDVGTVFGATPYVIVEDYTVGANCALTDLAGIATYVADGKCHKTGDATSFSATRTEAGALAVTTYTDAECTVGSEDLELSATATQAEKNSCQDGPDGILDKMVYGSSFTPLYLQSAATFVDNEDNCEAPGKPTFLDTTVVDPNVCSTSTVCTAADDLFTGTLCSSTATFKDDAGAAFGSTPYVVVETYAADTACATTTLESSKTYAADAKCHATSADASFFATRSKSGDMTVTIYSDVACQDAVGSPLTVGADDDGSCSNNKVVYGVGESPTVLSTVQSFDDAACAKPAQLVVMNEFSCTPSTECTETSGLYLQHSCSADHFDAADTMFSDAPYVVVELYKEDDCTTLDGVEVYSSDKKCHVAIDGSSFTSTLADTGDGDLVQYSDGKCEATDDGKSTTALSAEILGVDHPCTDKAKYFAFNGPLPPSSTSSSGSSTPSTTTKTPSTTTETPSTPTTTTATPSSTTEAPTTTSTGSGTSDATSRFTTSSTLTASLGLLAAAFGLFV